MKRFFGFAIALSTFLSLGLHAQSTEVQLHFNHQLNGVPMVYGTYTEQDGYSWFASRVAYYVSQIEVLHDGGTWTAVEDTWLLVDAEGTETVSLGTFPLTQVEGLRFYIGVEPAYNNEDPATYPADHPLAYQTPSMHWGWTSGYRFACMEGQAGSVIGHFEFHGLGNANYHQVELLGDAVAESGVQVFYINADYAQAVKGFNLSLGPLEHSETGRAAQFLQAFADDVFSRGSGPQGPASSIASASGEGLELNILGHPLQAGSAVAYRMPQGQIGSLEVLDAMGRILWRIDLEANAAQLRLPELPRGLHQLVLRSGAARLQRGIVVP